MKLSKRSTAQILADFRRVESQLSPENLTCDGELSGAQVVQKQASLMRKWALLVSELGRQPTKADLGGY